MGAEKTVLPGRSEPADWVGSLQEAFAPGRKAADLKTPDFRFVDYAYDKPPVTNSSQAQNTIASGDQREIPPAQRKS